ncbi:MAG: histidine kinase [Gemmatimonadales bacterium]|nr:histidine kinase [Gemmatimonadales bacterium]
MTPSATGVATPLRWPPWWATAASAMLGVELAVAGIARARPGRADAATAIAITLLTYPLLWCALAPVVERLERAVRAAAVRPAARLLLHAAAAASLSAVHTSVAWSLRSALGVGTDAGLPPLADALLQWMPLNVLAYAMILGAWSALRYRDEAAARAREARRLEEELASARLRALRMQLDPHFLFNTMHTVAMLVRGGRGEEAVTMLAGFSDLLRGVLLADHRDLVPLREEVALAERYLGIEAVRFGDRLHVQVDVAEEAAGAMVPALLLQPIVENAVRHGIDLRPQGGTIALAARVEAGGLRVVVEDAGDEIATPRRPGSGVGLGATRERLARRFGDDAGVTLEVHPAGARATVRLPVIRAQAGAG